MHVHYHIKKEKGNLCAKIKRKRGTGEIIKRKEDKGKGKEIMKKVFI